MSNIKALAQEVNAEYGEDIVSSVKQLIPTMIKSIKNPRKSINPAFVMRERLTRRRLLKVGRRYDIDSTDPVEISAQMNKREKYKIGILMFIADMFTNRIGMGIIVGMFRKTKLATALGKILVNMALSAAYVKAGVSLSKLSELNDKQKFTQFTAFGFSRYIIQADDENNKALEKINIKETISNQIMMTNVLNGMDYGTLGALSLGTAIITPINEEASKAVAEKYNFGKEYSIVFNTIRITQSVISSGMGMSSLISVQSAGVIMHITNTMLHKKGLGWAAYIIHAMWNLFAGSIELLLKSGAQLEKIIQATSK